MKQTIFLEATSTTLKALRAMQVYSKVALLRIGGKKHGWLNRAGKSFKEPIVVFALGTDKIKYQEKKQAKSFPKSNEI